MSWFTRCSYKYFCFTQIDIGKILQKQFFQVEQGFRWKHLRIELQISLKSFQYFNKLI